MNCTECREQLVAHAEALLDSEASFHCRTHLEACADCRAEFAAITQLQDRLVQRGAGSAGLSMSEAVMRRIQAAHPNQAKESTMKNYFSGWGFRLSAAACAASIVAVLLVLSPGTSARAAQVLAQGAQAVAQLSTIHLQCRMRARPGENFVAIEPEQDFSSVEVWKQFGAKPQWRIEKPGRVAVTDGLSAVLYDKQSNTATKEAPSVNAFDTQWLQRIADLGETIHHELQDAKAKGWKLQLTEEQAADGRMKSVVTILAKSGLPEGDYLKNVFIDTSDTRRVYRFDAQSGLLEGAQFYLARPTGEVLIFEITRIECNQPISSSVFQLELPENVAWSQEQPLQAGDERYIAMGAEQAARSYFEALGREDWSEVAKFLGGRPLNEKVKRAFGGLTVRSIGRPYTSKASSHTFVPYEVQLRNGEVKKLNLALRRNAKTGLWCEDGGI